MQMTASVSRLFFFPEKERRCEGREAITSTAKKPEESCHGSPARRKNHRVPCVVWDRFDVFSVILTVAAAVWSRDLSSLWNLCGLIVGSDGFHPNAKNAWPSCVFLLVSLSRLLASMADLEPGSVLPMGRMKIPGGGSARGATKCSRKATSKRSVKKIVSRS